MKKILLLKLRHKIRSLIDVYPLLYLSLCRFRKKTRSLMVKKDTEIVIEGFPRSANTFAVAAFNLAQERPVRIARHLHAPAQVIAAVRMKIPTLVLIRQPKDAVISLLVREPHISVEQALKDYIRFYSSILSYKKKYVTAHFEEVTQAFDRVIERVNRQFGTNFKLFQYTKENLKKCFQSVEQMDKEDTRLPYVRERSVARPSEERKALRAAFEKKFENPRVKDLLLKAENLYNQFVSENG